jgi:hypothetical protein
MSASEVVFEKIMESILKQDIEEVREHLKNNFIQYEELYSFLYERAGDFKQPGAAILLIGKYLYQNFTMAIKEINFMAMLMEMILNKVI